MRSVSTTTIADRVRRLAVRLPIVLFIALLSATPAWGAPAETPDAVYDLWEQHWTLNADGSQVYHVKQHVQLNNERAYDEFADPRITYDDATQKLEIITARTRLPGGTYRELADYGHVFVSPDQSAGWPAFATIRQHLLVMGGVEPGCVLELEYKLTTAADARPYLEGSARLDAHYPIRQRVVSVTVPDGTPVKIVVHGLAAGRDETVTTSKRWEFKDLAAVPHEPQSPPWPATGGRLVFTTAASEEAWLKARLAELDTAGQPAEYVTKLAMDWVGTARAPADKLRALQEKLASVFNAVEFPASWRPAAIRPAEEVAACNHGLPVEATAVLLALARAAGLTVSPAIVAADHAWRAEVPQDALVAAYVVVLEGVDPAQIWDARHGRIVRDAHWAGHTLLWHDEARVQRKGLPPFGNPDESRCRITGRVEVRPDGTLGGELRVHTSGLFVAPEALRTADDQKRRLSGLVGRTVADAKVEDFSVVTLTDNVFEAVVKVKSAGALEKWGPCHRLQLAEDGPFLGDIHLPLSSGVRAGLVWLTGPFDEQIELEIAWPAEWSIAGTPGAVSGTTGVTSVAQTVTPGEHSLTLSRHVRVEQRRLLPETFLTLRETLNELRSPYARTLLLKP